MNAECLICKAPLEYLPQAEMMECALCHKQEMSNTRCVNGHYVCSDCHTEGMDAIIGMCLAATSKDPFEILEQMMDAPFCYMHGPEHHVMVGAALLAAYKNAGGEVDLENALMEMYNRGKQVPGGICGLWGSCGAAVSSGIFISIITGADPLTKESWGMANLMTSKALNNIGVIGGPRCCKRNGHIAIETAIDFVAENLGVQMEKNKHVCRYFKNNNQCIGKRCPYSPANNK